MKKESIKEYLKDAIAAAQNPRDFEGLLEHVSTQILSVCDGDKLHPALEN